MEKVVVFGGSGFLGSHVVDALASVGYEVLVYDRSPSKVIPSGARMLEGDILDAKEVRRAVKGATYVYNFAGIADIQASGEDPFETVKQNILGNTVILEACRQEGGVGRFIFASTLYVYSKAGGFYRSTKQACELLIENYYENYKLPYTILRYGSLYGPRAGRGNFVYEMVRQALSEGVISRDGDGEEIREYIHVTDAARCSVEILVPEFEGQYVMVTGDRQIKVKDLLLMVREMLDNKVNIVYRPASLRSHYEITPYSFAPRFAKKLVTKTYVDLGQGLLSCLEEAHRELNNFSRKPMLGKKKK